jgi:hypothetical protein
MVRDQNLDPKAWIKKPGKKTTTGFLNMGSVTKLQENKTLFIPCDCRSEILLIEYDHEMKMADFAIYETNISNKMSLWQRLEYCWQILVKKKPYADAIILNNKQLIDLKIFLDSLDLR